MVDDVKSLAKKNADLEKRLKFAEAKIKVLADSMTSAKDIEKYLDVLHNKMSSDMQSNIKISEKAVMRAHEISKKATDADIKEYDQAAEKHYMQAKKEMEKFQKQSVRQAEFSILQSRIMVLETLVASIRR